MLERLLGRFAKTVRYESLKELADALAEVSGVARVVIYPEGSDTIIIAHVYPDGRVRAVGYREGEGLVRPDLETIMRGGYAEIYSETGEQASMDYEIMESVAVAEGKNLGDIVVEASLPDLLARSPGLAEAGGGGGEEECSIGLRDILERFGSRFVIDDKLSRLLSYPSTTGRILLTAELSTYDKVECRAVKDIIMDHFEAYDAVAIKFSTGPYTAWIVKCGDRVGAALFEKSKMRLAGTKIIEKMDKVERFIAEALRKHGKATVMVYLVPKKLVMECNEVLSRRG